MFVLIDLEWIVGQQQEKELTQISAVRVDKSWEIQDEFHATVCPSQPNRVIWTHMAYHGHSRDSFLQSPTEAACLADFASWLRGDDILCSWAHSVQGALRKLWKRRFGKTPDQEIISSNGWVYRQLLKHHQLVEGLYTVAQLYDIPLLFPEHCSRNDVYMMLEVFRALAISQEQLCKEQRPTKAEHNALVLQKTNYNYVYTPTSQIFHKPSCKAMLQANEIIGCELYKTACKKRRPCKICCPVDLLPPPARPAPKQTTPPETLQKFRLFDNSIIETYPRKIVGCCHHRIHPGKMTKRLLKQHDCLGKQCKYLERYNTSTYWTELDKKRNKRKSNRLEKQQQRAMELTQKEEMQEIADELQDYADLCDYDIDIIDVRQEGMYLFKVFYISDNTYPDGQLYSGLIELASHCHPQWRLLLRHIKDENGRFVTIDEFYARKRA